MSKLIVTLLFVFLLLQGNGFGDSPVFTTVGNLYPSTTCKLGTRVSGRIEDVFVKIGDSVKKGQPLVQIDKRPYEIDVSEKEAVLESAKIELQDAMLNYQRMKKLWEKPQGETPSISQKRFEEAKLRYEQAKVKMIQNQQDLRRARLNLEETTIRASFNGIVSSKFVDPGENVTDSPSTYIVEIQAIDPLFLEFSIPQAYLNTINVGTPVSFQVEGATQEKYHAQIDLIYPCIDEATRTVKSRAVINNSNLELHPGSLAKVEINNI